MHDRGNLFGFQSMSGAQLQQHRGGGRPAIAHERRLLRYGQMHPCRLDRLQGGNGARQFALEGVLVARIFHELTDTKTRILADQFEAAVLALWQSLRGKLQTCIVHSLGRHHDRAAGVVEFVFDAAGLQRLDHAAGVGVGQVAVQQAPARSLPPQHHGDADGYRQGDAEQQQQRPDVHAERTGKHYGLIVRHELIVPALLRSTCS